MTVSSSDRLINTLTDAPFNIVPAQVLDFTAWLNGIDEDRATGMHHFSDGEIAHALARIHNCTDAASLKDEWLTARHAQRNAKTVQELEQEAAAWLF